MTATIEIPDSLYRKVEAKAKARGLKITEVTAELYERWVAEDRDCVEPDDGQAWLDAWVAMGSEACQDLPAGPTGRELIQQDRQRLEAR